MVQSRGDSSLCARAPQKARARRKHQSRLRLAAPTIAVNYAKSSAPTFGEEPKITTPQKDTW